MRLTRRSHTPSLSIICALALTLCVVLTSHRDARAQAPNTQAASQTNATPQSTATRQSSATLEPHVFHVTVIDEKGKPVSGVKRENLTAFDGGKQCEIVAFDAGNVPTSIMFLVDASSSVFGLNKNGPGVQRVASLKGAVKAFVEGGNGSEEYFVTVFNNSTQVLLDGTTDARAVSSALDRLTSTEMRGQTALYDALYLSVNKLALRPMRKHVLILLSDGQDNVSHYTLADVMRALKESDVIVYALGVMNEDDSSLVYAARNILIDLAAETGGVSYYARNEKEMNATLAQVAAELRNQYEVTIATEPNAKGDGRHSVRFKLGELRDAQGKRVKAGVRTRRGFYDAGATRGK